MARYTSQDLIWHDYISASLTTLKSGCHFLLFLPAFFFFYPWTESSSPCVACRSTEYRVGFSILKATSLPACIPSASRLQLSGFSFIFFHLPSSAFIFLRISRLPMPPRPDFCRLQVSRLGTDEVISCYIFSSSFSPWWPGGVRVGKVGLRFGLASRCIADPPG